MSPFIHWQGLNLKTNIMKQKGRELKTSVLDLGRGEQNEFQPVKFVKRTSLSYEIRDEIEMPNFVMT